MAMEWSDGIAGGIVVMVMGSYKLIGTLSRALIARRNGKANGSGNGLKAHNDSARAHPDIRQDISKMDEKLDSIGDTGNRILANLKVRPCLKDCERRDDN